MKKLKDKINFLTWEQFEPQQAENYHQQNATLDKWGKRVASNSFINKKHFITNLYTDFYGDESNFFYCYENNGDSIKDMVGAVIITPPTHKGNNASIDYIVVNHQQPWILCRQITHWFIRSSCKRERYCTSNDFCKKPLHNGTKNPPREHTR